VVEKLRKRCWNQGNILENKKQIKFLSTLAKEGHPVRKCALGGKINKQITELSEAVSNGVSGLLAKNFKTHYTTVAASVRIVENGCNGKKN
jgi:hypothetical protein